MDLPQKSAKPSNPAYKRKDRSTAFSVQLAELLSWVAQREGDCEKPAGRRPGYEVKTLRAKGACLPL